MITNYQQGDLVQMLRNSEMGVAPEMVMVHGCNCKKVMGGGIAGQLARTFPEVPKADQKAHPILGTYSVATLSSTSNVDGIRATVVNAYTQEQFGTNKRHLNYAAVGKVFSYINDTWKGQTVYIPRIGAGLGGGDWEIIELIIDDATPNVSIIVIDFRKGHDPRL